jgi:hypothetical protein
MPAPKKKRRRIRQIIIKCDLLALMKDAAELRDLLRRTRDQLDLQRRAIEYLAAGSFQSKKDVANILADQLIF